MADYVIPENTKSAVSFKKGNNISSYTSKNSGDLLLEVPTSNYNIARLYYCDGENVRSIIPYEYGSTLPTTNNYEGKVFFKTI